MEGAKDLVPLGCERDTISLCSRVRAHGFVMEPGAGAVGAGGDFAHKKEKKSNTTDFFFSARARASTQKKTEKVKKSRERERSAAKKKIKKMPKSKRLRKNTGETMAER